LARKLPISVRYLKEPLKYSLIGAFSLVMVIEGIDRTTVSSMQAIFMFRPLLMALGGVLLLKERVKKPQLVALFIGLFGFLLLAAQPYVYKGTNISVGTLEGNVLVMIAGVTGVIYTLCARKLSKRYPPEVLTYSIFIASVVTFSLVIVLKAALGYEVAVGVLALKDWYIMSFLVFFSSILMFFLSQVGIKLTSMVYVAIGNYVQFLVTIMLGIKLFNDSITPLFIAGSILILLAALIGSITNNKEST
jgi:drug/metabolite transporter (DMT)-like permease